MTYIRTPKQIVEDWLTECLARHSDELAKLGIDAHPDSEILRRSQAFEYAEDMRFTRQTPMVYTHIEGWPRGVFFRWMELVDTNDYHKRVMQPLLAHLNETLPVERDKLIQDIEEAASRLPVKDKKVVYLIKPLAEYLKGLKLGYKVQVARSYDDCRIATVPPANPTREQLLAFVGHYILLCI